MSTLVSGAPVWVHPVTGERRILLAAGRYFTQSPTLGHWRYVADGRRIPVTVPDTIADLDARIREVLP